MEFCLFIGDMSPQIIVGMDVVYEAYHKACELAEMLNIEVDLVVVETGEIIASNKIDIEKERLECYM